MPRLDYRARPETILPGVESQIVLEVVVAEINALRAILDAPPLSEADVRRALRDALQRRRPPKEAAPCN